jgi:CO/xanthine dehydrogenase FAD-binding subunit
MSYLIAGNLDQALTLLQAEDKDYRVIAGATDLFLQKLPENLVDINAVPELLIVGETENTLEIGAAVTHATVSHSPLIRRRATALAEASSQVGSPQIRNIGTIGGNVVNAAPAADAAVALVALGAKAIIINSSKTIREEPVESLYLDYNKTAIDSCNEIIIKFNIEVNAAESGSAFLRFAARQSLSLPMVNAAAWVMVENNRLIKVRLVLAPVKPAPTRLKETEKRLLNAPLTAETWSKAGEAAAEEVTVRGSLLRCSAQYRRHLVKVLAGRVIEEAVKAASGGKEV